MSTFVNVDQISHKSYNKQKTLIKCGVIESQKTLIFQVHAINEAKINNL